MIKASRAFIAVLVCCACAAYAIPASATTTTIGAAPDLTGNFLNCPWGYADAENGGLVAHGETVVTPSQTHTVLDSFSFYVTQLRDGGQLVGGSRTITYKAYVGKWDPNVDVDGDEAADGDVTETVWESPELRVTTSPDLAKETTVKTGGVRLEPGQQYALYFSTEETNGFNTLADRGCGAGAIANENGYPYGGGVSLIRYLGGDFATRWQPGFADVAFKASFSDFDFHGFYAPVDNKDALGNYVLNKVNAGAAIPVKFSLGGDYGLDVFADGYPKSQRVDCNANAVVDTLEETVTAGSSSLSYAAGSDTYNYVWKTDQSWEDTCRQLVIEFDDGTTARANFKFH